MNPLSPSPLPRAARAVVAALAVIVAGLVTVGLQGSAHATPIALTGLFELTPGHQAGTSPATGTYFRMIQPGAGTTYLDNGDSRADDKSYTILNRGTDGGLKTGVDQAAPSPAFDASGNSLSSRIIAPEPFFGTEFSVATNKKDPQTAKTTVLPSISADGTTLTGNLSAFAASWNNQNFNQGSPKPDGTSAGGTQAVTGTYDPQTKAFVLTWRSLIVGGPFNSFVGEWHLAGTFVPTVSVTTSSLPSGVIGSAYSAPLAATGGKSSYTWSLASGALPAGLKISSGKVSGTPTAPGIKTFTVLVADSTTPKNYATRQLSITIPPIAVNVASLPEGVVGKAYPSTKLTSAGGKSTLAWTVTSGSLPTGLKLSTSGTLSGTPTTAGTSTFTAQVADGSTPKNIASRQFTITVDPFTVATASLPGGAVGTAYPTTKLTANGGKGTLTWKVVSGALPTGLKLSTAGSLSGKPTVAGTSTFTVAATDTSSPKNTATKTFAVVVSG